MKFDLTIEDGIYYVKLCALDSGKKLGEVMVDSKRNEYTVLTPKNDKRSEEDIESINRVLYDTIIKRIAIRPVPNMLIGETVPYAIKVIKDIMEEYKDSNSKDKETIILDEAIRDIKLYNQELIPENRVLR